MNKNPFATAVAATPTKKSGKNGKVEKTINGLELYAALDAAEKAIKSLKETNRPAIDTQLYDYFIGEGLKSKAQPANFRGIERSAQASCELRKKSVRSPLNEQEIEILTEAGIPTEEIVDKPETFIINPSYLGDEKLIKKVGEALGKIKDIPVDFIQKQEAKKTTVVTDETLTAVFRHADLQALLPIVSGTTIKSQLASDLLADVLKQVIELAGEKKD